MHIGSLKVKNPFFLAPMHKINDPAFRELCLQNGAGMVYTWLLNPLTRDKLDFKDKPAIQIAPPSPKGVREFIKKHEKNASMFDLNLGCPAVKAKEQDYGAFLHRHPAMIDKILKTMRNSTKLPITVKIRKSAKVMKLLPIFEKHCDAIAIHPRTAEQGYSGVPDMAFAERLKKRSKIPIIYSGDVDESNALDLLKKSDFVMIGRKAIGNPGIFARLAGKKPKDSFSDYLRLAKKHKLKLSQIRFQALNFTKGMDNAAKARARLSKAKDIKEISLIMRSLG